ncbi:GRIP and coiled-coil domain-containing protein 1 [Trichogramma pretiosum]|uniref:GRIP and coiled-coil domain-containing protein 1 n=1 Tax=Trichogramma pretiosum TaxID=7493 RepID=UPI0006C9518F|nr:GRIP and coiled-coil domain-containing protein 1 [Trichogramma pretiosum]
MEISKKNVKKENSSVQTDIRDNLQDVKTKGDLQVTPDKDVKENYDEKSSNVEGEDDTVEGLKKQLETLMNSLAVLSSEKSRMEANFQSEKRQIRSERDENERVVKNLKEKMKRIQGHAMSEVEHLKYKLIMERHEREKEQNDHSAITKELQKAIKSEQLMKEQLEAQLKELKTGAHSKSQTRLLEAEIDVLKNKLKIAESAANETPAMLQNLQTEMSLMKKKYKNAIAEEQKRAAAAEQEAKTLAANHESRVAILEARLAELSDVVGSYDRHRHQDQKAIYALKEQLISLQNHQKSDNVRSPQEYVDTIKKLYFQLMEIDNNKSCTYIKELLSSLKLIDKGEESTYKEKYNNICQEFDDFKKLASTSSSRSQSTDTNLTKDETQLCRTKSHNKNLEEKLRMLYSEMSEREKEFKIKLEMQQQQSLEQYTKYEQVLSQKDSEYLNRIATLEQQLQRQRERSLSVIQEKDREIQTLKSSFEALLPKKKLVTSESSGTVRTRSNDVGNLMSSILSTENNPPMLHYTQELARKEVQVSTLRKQNMQMEAALRELERNSIHAQDKHEENIKKYEAQIKRLEASKSRENANLEYLKNVFINYLMSKDAAQKRHMLNAISTILRFSNDESEKLMKTK